MGRSVAAHGVTARASLRCREKSQELRFSFRLCREASTTTSFVAKVEAAGNNTGIEAPAEKLAELGTSKRPAVKVDRSGYSYPSTVSVMGGKYMISMSAYAKRKEFARQVLEAKAPETKERRIAMIVAQLEESKRGLNS